MAPGETSMLMEQFAALGYLDATEMHDDGAPEAVRREMDWNLARSQIDAGTPEVAIPTLERLCAAWPERGDFGLALCEALCTIGSHDEAQALVEAMVFHQREHPRARYLQGVIAAANGEPAEALDHLRDAAQTRAGRPELHTQIGFAALRLKDLALAERSFAAAAVLIRISLRRRPDWPLPGRTADTRGLQICSRRRPSRWRRPRIPANS